MIVTVNNYFFLTKTVQKSIWKMTVMLNRATKGTFSCLKTLFQVLKIRKKGYMEMIEKFYLET